MVVVDDVDIVACAHNITISSANYKFSLVILMFYYIIIVGANTSNACERMIYGILGILKCNETCMYVFAFIKLLLYFRLIIDISNVRFYRHKLTLHVIHE